ncbi:MAG: MFS transporter [Candidatus Omnitrophica bacterium]|nr:MFS transporter [Candidatus Omnitrophota bacterium]
MSKNSFSLFCVSFFTLSFGVAAMAALVPQFALYFAVPPVQAARLIWLYMLPYGVCALLWSPLTRIMAVKKILLFTMAGYSLSTFGFAFSSTLPQAYIFRFLMGCFGCSFVPLILITIGKSVPQNEKSKYIGTLFAISYVSTCVSVFLSGFIPWRGLYLIPAGMSFLMLLIIPIALDEFDFRRESFKVSYVDTFRDRGALNFFIVIILVSFFYHSVQQWLGVYFKIQYGLTQVLISSILTVSTVSATGAEFLGGILAARIGNIHLARIGFMVMALFCGILFFLRLYSALFMVMLFWGGGWALTHVGLSSHLTHFPDKILRDSSSLNSALRFFAGGIGAAAGGISISHLGFQTHFLIVGAALLVMGFLLPKSLAHS